MTRRLRDPSLICGIISTAFVRNQGITELDVVDSAELDYALELLAPNFTV